MDLKSEIKHRLGRLTCFSTLPLYPSTKSYFPPPPLSESIMGNHGKNEKRNSITNHSVSFASLTMSPPSTLIFMSLEEKKISRGREKQLDSVMRS